MLLYPAVSVGQHISITIHLRGVSESKISLLPMAGPKAYKPILELSSLKNGDTAVLRIPAEYLPGEFVLRFDYKEKPQSTPYPSEKLILVGSQSFELWTNPMYANNADSTWFGSGEKENNAFARFNSENNLQKQKIGLLQQFLMEYDQPESDFYRLGTQEYEKRRQAYKHWLVRKATDDSSLFASSLYRFSYLPQISFSGSERDRLLSMIDHYFDGIDFNNPIILRTSLMNDWMNAYVNMHGQMATTVALRDSIIPAAAVKAIEKAKQGNPLVYGWMVDYFYRGFEANDLPTGMKVLKPYLNDPDCLTTKRMEIERRLRGMETLTIGSVAPDIVMNDANSKPFRLSTYQPATPYILLLFWSADCSHCRETIDKLYPWYQQGHLSTKMPVIAISLDETTTEVSQWEQRIKTLSAFKHLRAEEGISSKVANDYFILATPVMMVLDGKSKKVLALPSTIEQLHEFIR